jgi:hypothetical protein
MYLTASGLKVTGDSGFFTNYPSVTRVRELAQIDETIRTEWHKLIEMAYQAKDFVSLTNRELENLTFKFLVDKFNEFNRMNDDSVDSVFDSVDSVFDSVISLNNTILTYDRVDLKIKKPLDFTNYFYMFLIVYAVGGAAIIGAVTAYSTPDADPNIVNERLAEIKANARR